MIKSSFVQVSPAAQFSYQPPPTANTAQRILVKPNLGYPVAAPVTVSLEVLQQVLHQIRKVNPTAEILIVEGVCSAMSLGEITDHLGISQVLDSGMQILDADKLKLIEYPNLSPQPVRYPTMLAPALLKEVDCRITVGALKRTHLKGEPLISASLKNLYGLFPRSHYKARSPNSRGQLHRPSVPLILQDVYFCVGHLFDGAVVDGNQKFYSPNWKPDKGKSIPLGQVFWGDDIISVDREACRIATEPIPSYLEAIDQLRSPL
ncbi:MAG: DUF362 domain-containing protein [Microcoleaceae cyanobacterium]